MFRTDIYSHAQEFKGVKKRKKKKRIKAKESCLWGGASISSTTQPC